VGVAHAPLASLAVATATLVATRAAQSAAHRRAAKSRTDNDIDGSKINVQPRTQGVLQEWIASEVGGTVLPRFRSPLLFPLRLSMTATKGREQMVTIDL
jgi:hypothetical protein